MPLEIKELHIKVTVNQPNQGQSSAAAPAAGTGGKGGDDKEAMIAQCVDEVLDIINNKKER